MISPRTFKKICESNFSVQLNPKQNNSLFVFPYFKIRFHIKFSPASGIMCPILNILDNRLISLRFLLIKYVQRKRISDKINKNRNKTCKKTDVHNSSGRFQKEKNNNNGFFQGLNPASQHP